MSSDIVGGRYFLAFDHRGSFESGVGGLVGGPEVDRRAAIVDAKELIFEGVEMAAADMAVSQVGVLVDEAYGGAVPERAKELGITLALPAERSGCEVFEFEYGEKFRERIAHADPDITKVLVRHNVEGDPAALELQADRLRMLSEWLGDEGRQFLFELLVPPTPTQLDRFGGDPVEFETHGRPELICRGIEHLQDADVEPTTWKVEGVESGLDAQAVVAAARRGGRERVDCVLLGAGAPIARVNRWLRIAAEVDGFVGFAIGRSIWWPPLERYLTGRAERDAAAAEVANAYRRFVDVFADPRNARSV